MRSFSRRPGGSRRRRRILIGVGLVAAVAVLLAIPLVRGVLEARSAERELSEAASELQAGDVSSARKSVTAARDHIDAAQGGAQGIAGDVWSRVPFVGTPVADVRHLIQALDDAVSVAEIGIDLYPSVAGKQATLFVNGHVERRTLDQVIEGVREAGPHLTSAKSELDQVSATTPFIGASIAARRDAAAERVSPLADGVTRLEPLLDELPSFFGFSGQRSYLIAMLNPSELRYSGGAALAFAPMTWDEGTLEIGEAFPLVQDDRLRVPLTWRGVKGNVFHRSDTYLASSTFAPSWSVSGEELLRAWRSATGVGYDGVMAVDVVAMAYILDATGPTTAPGVGELNGANLTQTVVGSYDDFYPDPTIQDQTFANVVAALQTQLFSGGDYISKGRAIKDAASGRHLALYFEDDAIQAAFGALGMDGDLTDPAGDYVGAFTQSTVGAKVDYYQRRTIDLDVTLDADGTATDRLDVRFHNDTPPYAVPGTDPREGYFTRWASLAASAFLPGSADIESFSLGEQRSDGRARTFYDHSFVADTTVIPPGGSTLLRVSYSVPGAAAADESGALVYRLAMDPQGTVFPASADVTVHVPDGYRATTLPDGWSAQGTTLTFHTDALVSSEDWEIPLEPDN